MPPFLIGMNILIPTVHLDVHAIAVDVALTDRDHKVFRWLGEDYPCQQNISVEISNDLPFSGLIKGRGIEFPINRGAIDIVWLRRPRWPSMPTSIHVDDQKIAHDECKTFIRWLWQATWQEARWINPLEGARRASSKLLQLATARRVGLSIPKTLITNTKEEVKSFIAEHREHGAVVKPMQLRYWQSADGRCEQSFTAELTKTTLPNEAGVQAAPAIYQEKVQKAYEVRVTFFGRTHIAAAIYSQSSDATENDWRAIDANLLQMKLVSIPASVEAACIEMMRDLGISFGCFDFAVTEDGEHVFFEVNEQGQFLWIEDRLPEAPMLDTFVRFIEGDLGKKASRIHFHEIRKNSRFREIVQQEGLRQPSTAPTATL